MDNYRKILLALDLAEDAEQVIERAAGLAQLCGAQLHLIHVVEPIIVDPAYDVLPALPAGYEQDLVKFARERLSSLAREHGIPVDRCKVAVGATKSAVVSEADEGRYDLIVVGSHGRHGLALLLGSTANAVLHGAPCDVLAVRIGKRP